MSEPQERCRTCRHWEPDSSERVASEMGMCVRRSPVIRDGDSPSAWPRTYKLDRCGEHQALRAHKLMQISEWLSKNAPTLDAQD